MVDMLPNFVDMALSPSDQKDCAMPCPPAGDTPVYPWGLSISLSQDELDKLDLADDCCPGDHVLLHCLAKVTSVSKNDTAEGCKTRVEMQITAIAAEDDDSEDEAPAPRKRLGPSSLYK